MNNKTLKALKESIEHWKENVQKAKSGNLVSYDISGDKCPLCKLFVNYESHPCGRVCPVKRYGGCYLSPWGVVVDILDSKSHKGIVKACENELAFLKSLLPKQRKNNGKKNPVGSKKVNKTLGREC